MTAIYTNLAAGTITDDPLTNLATAVNSPAFATLPIVAAPNFMWMTFDPAGTAGTPEIVKVTAHGSGATVCTVVRAQQTSQGGGAAREHLLDTKWVVGLTANDADDLPHRLLTAKGGLISASAANTPSVLAPGPDGTVLTAKTSELTGLAFTTVLPSGMITPFGGSAAPTGWLLCDGAAVSRSTYADLFAVVSTLYGVGDGASTFNVPNMKGRIPAGYDSGSLPYDTLGETGGAATKALVSGNLPAHVHTIDHDHGAVTSAAGGSHLHTIDHDHGSVASAGASADHSHAFTSGGQSATHHHDSTNSGYQTLVADIPSSTVYTNAGANVDHTAIDGSWDIGTATATGDASGDHTHSGTTAGHSVDHTHLVDLPNFTGNSGAEAAHTHSVDVAAYTGNSGSVGSGTAVDILNPYLVLNYLIKT